MHRKELSRPQFSVLLEPKPVMMLLMFGMILAVADVRQVLIVLGEQSESLVLCCLSCHTHQGEDQFRQLILPDDNRLAYLYRLFRFR